MKYPQATVDHARGRYVVPRTVELEMQVDTVMRGFEFTSYAEMLRTLIYDAYRHLQRDPHYKSLVRHDIEEAEDRLSEELAFCPGCERYVARKMWNSDPHLCDDCTSYPPHTPV